MEAVTALEQHRAADASTIQQLQAVLDCKIASARVSTLHGCSVWLKDFVVDTPSIAAVEECCLYTLSITPAQGMELRTSQQVSFSRAD